MRHADAHHPLFEPVVPANNVRLQSRSRGGASAHDRVAEAVTAGLLMLRRARRQWRCFRHTAGAHDIDLHSGACRYCGTRTGERL